MSYLENFPIGSNHMTWKVDKSHNSGAKKLINFVFSTPFLERNNHKQEAAIKFEMILATKW